MKRSGLMVRLGRRILVVGVLVAVIGGGARWLHAQNQSVDGQDACSLACRDTYQSCKSACDPGDTACADGCSSDLTQCLSNCH
jgi:hypothetical protein